MKNIKLTVSKKIYKNEKLNRARYQKYGLPHYRILLILIPKVIKIDADGKILPIEEMKTSFILTAKEYSETFKVDLDSSYKILKTAPKVLIETNIELERIDSKNITFINFCAKAEYRDNRGELYVEITHSIKPYLYQGARRYVLYKLKDVAPFRSLYSLRLYELIQGYRKSGWAFLSTENIKKIFNLNSRYKKYSNFKSRVLLGAIKEINSHYPELCLEFKEFFDRRKVVSIKFMFTADKNALPASEIPALQRIPNRNLLTKDEAIEKLKLAEERRLLRIKKAEEKKILASGGVLPIEGQKQLFQEKKIGRIKKISQVAESLLKKPISLQLTEKEEIAINMLKEKATVTFVVKTTGISMKRIKELLQKIKD